MKIEDSALLATPIVEASMRAPGNTPFAIEAVALEKTYGETRALAGMSVQVRRGETVALIGPNGAGKSTLVEILVGLKKPDAGSARVLGHDMIRHAHANRERIGVQFQSTQMFDRLTVRDYLSLFRSFYERTADIADLTARLGLTNSLDKRINALSGGYRQRLALALALVNDPEIVFLDEPTVGLDPIVRMELWDLIRQLKLDNKTILFSTHYMEEAQALADHLLMISHGRLIAQGSKEQIIALAGTGCSSLDDAYRYFAQTADRRASC